jgi:DNA-binding Xre family transcriptional regulator
MMTELIFLKNRFLLAKLHLDSLVGKRTVREIRTAIESLPKGIEQLGKAYDETLAQIKSEAQSDVDRALKVIFWVTHAKRLLSAAELQEALAVKADDTELDKDDLVRLDEIVEICGGLVTVDGELASFDSSTSRPMSTSKTLKRTG